MNKLSFRIRKKYFDAIVNGEKGIEYRRDITFWRTRIGNIFHSEKIWKALKGNGLFSALPPEPVIGVFICGKRSHRRKILVIAKKKTPDYFSDQGKRDVNTKTCFAFFLGVAIE